MNVSKRNFLIKKLPQISRMKYNVGKLKVIATAKTEGIKVSDLLHEDLL